MGPPCPLFTKAAGPLSAARPKTPWGALSLDVQPKGRMSLSLVAQSEGRAYCPPHNQKQMSLSLTAQSKRMSLSLAARSKRQLSLSLTAQSKRMSLSLAARSKADEPIAHCMAKRQTRTQGQYPDSQGGSSLLSVDEVTLNPGTGSMLVPTSFATSASKRLIPVGVLRLRRSRRHAMEGNPAMGG